MRKKKKRESCMDSEAPRTRKSRRQKKNTEVMLKLQTTEVKEKEWLEFCYDRPKTKKV